MADETYKVKDLSTPVVYGTVLKMVTTAIEYSTTVRNKIAGDSNMFVLRERQYTEAPLLLPIAAPDGDHDAATPVDPFSLLSDKVVAPQESFRSATIADYHEAYKSGRCSPVDIAKRFLTALEKADESSKPLRAFISVNSEDIMKRAEESAARYRAGNPLSPLDGVPVAVKDELHQLPYKTTAGTAFLNQYEVPHNAAVVERLNAAGALLLGKANMHEIGLGVTGANIHHGFARNPYNLGAHTGGSSSGSASSVAAGLAAVSVGCDGGGSIRIPAGLCGIYGLKATYGRVSEHGAVPIAPSVGHTGPMATTATDLAILYLMLAGPDPRDATTVIQPTPDLKDFHLTKDFSGIRIGVYKPFFEHASPAVVQACRAMLDQYVARGAKLVDIVLPELEEIRVAHSLTIGSEMRACFDAYMAKHRYEFALTTRLPLAVVELFTQVDYLQAAKVRARAMEMIGKVFREQCDVIAAPTTAITAPNINEPGIATDTMNGGVISQIMRFSPLGNFTGIPCITIPAGYDEENKPVGFQFMAKWWNEALLLRLAHAADEFVMRKAPQLHFSLLDQ